MENRYSYYNPNNQTEHHQNDFDNDLYGNSGQDRNNKKKKTSKVFVVIGCALLFGVLASITFVATNMVANRLLGLDVNEESVTTESNAVISSDSNIKTTSSIITSDVTEVVEEVMPSVVSITSLTVQEVQNFFGQTYQYESPSAGSGIIIAETEDELLLVTNNHVIADTEEITVTFVDESNVEAYVKGTNTDADIAVIAVPLEDIPDETKSAISVATLGDSTTLKVGEPAIAIGNALGYGQSVTTGVISALNRTATSTDSATGETVETAVKLIQTDAAINPGNSGGALLNAHGEVIGINSAKLASTEIEGMGYAIPISDISDILENLMSQQTKRKVSEEEKGYLGITGLDVTSEIAARYGMPEGVYVDSVAAGGGAESAGITKGNIITSLNGTTIQDMEALQQELGYYAVGETVSVTVQIPQNNGEYSEKTVQVVLGEAQE